MAPRSWAGTLVGYEAKNQWRIYDGKTVQVRRDVIFNESSLTYKKSPRITPIEQEKDTFDLAGLKSALEPVGVPVLTETSVPVGGDQGDQRLDNALDTVNRLLAEVNDAINSSVDEDIDDQITNPDSVDYQEDINPLILDHPRENTRHNYKDLHQRGFSKIAKVTAPQHGIVEPKTWEEAMNGPQKEQWMAACKEEVLSQLKKPSSCFHHRQRIQG